MAPRKTDGAEQQTELYPTYHPQPAQGEQGDLGPKLEPEQSYQVKAVEFINTNKFGEIAVLTLSDDSKRHTTSKVLVSQLKEGKFPATIRVTQPAGKRYYTIA